MNLNIPVLEQLSGCQNLLIAGMGGGFDVFCGLPIYLELRSRGQRVHLANYSFSDLTGLKDSFALNEGLVGITADQDEWQPYFPEYYLSRWFREQRGEEVTIWCFQKTGVRPLLASYQALVEHLHVDGILLIDGGVDSLMRGDETELGTILEDSVSLCVVNELDSVPMRLMACVGFGAEQQMSYAHVLENIASLTRIDAFLGSCALIRQMPAYKLYEDAVMYVQGQRGQDSSVISSSIVSSVQGHYGNYHLTEKTLGSKLWISPLMPLYWFFDSRSVARRNLLLPAVRWTDTFTETIHAAWKLMATLPKRKYTSIPLG